MRGAAGGQPQSLRGAVAAEDHLSTDNCRKGRHLGHCRTWPPGRDRPTRNSPAPTASRPEAAIDAVTRSGGPVAARWPPGSKALPVAAADPCLRAPVGVPSAAASAASALSGPAVPRARHAPACAVGPARRPGPGVTGDTRRARRAGVGLAVCPGGNGGGRARVDRRAAQHSAEGLRVAGEADQNAVCRVLRDGTTRLRFSPAGTTWGTPSTTKSTAGPEPAPAPRLLKVRTRALRAQSTAAAADTGSGSPSVRPRAPSARLVGPVSAHRPARSSAPRRGLRACVARKQAAAQEVRAVPRRVDRRPPRPGVEVGLIGPARRHRDGRGPRARLVTDTEDDELMVEFCLRRGARAKEGWPSQPAGASRE